MKDDNSIHVNKFSTRDLYIACALRAQGLEIVDLIKKDKIATFVFNAQDKNIPQLVKLYWNRQLTVDAREFVESINELKARAYSISE